MFVSELTEKDNGKKLQIESLCYADSYKSSAIALYGHTWDQVYITLSRIDEDNIFWFIVKSITDDFAITSITLHDDTTLKEYNSISNTKRSDGLIWEYNSDTKLWIVIGEY